jgi:hypothetical protein
VSLVFLKHEVRLAGSAPLHAPIRGAGGVLVFQKHKVSSRRSRCS